MRTKGTSWRDGSTVGIYISTFDGETNFHFVKSLKQFYFKDGTGLPRHQIMDHIFEGNMLDEINQLFLPNMRE